MKKRLFFLVFLVLAIFHFCQLACGGRSAHANPSDSPPKTDEGWVTMPAGGKPAYMGIHGGTMPVSLLVSGDGSSLLSYVGLTGNDFLEALREVYLPLPSFGNATRDSATMPGINASRTELFAGNGTASMPVMSISGDLFASKSWLGNLQPFGLSEEPLVIEGQVVKPESFSPARKYRALFTPDYLQPRRPKK